MINYRQKIYAHILGFSMCPWLSSISMTDANLYYTHSSIFNYCWLSWIYCWQQLYLANGNKVSESEDISISTLSNLPSSKEYYLKFFIWQWSQSPAYSKPYSTIPYMTVGFPYCHCHKQWCFFILERLLSASNSKMPIVICMFSNIFHIEQCSLSIWIVTASLGKVGRTA